MIHMHRSIASASLPTPAKVASWPSATPSARRGWLKTSCIAAAVFVAAGCATAGSYDDFFRSIKRDDASSITALLARGFDPNTTDARGEPGLLIALREPSPKVAKILIAAPATKVETRNSADESALMIAAIKGDVDSVQSLIARDADINKTGWTPLHYAVSVGGPQQLAIVKILLEDSAYIDAESPNKTTPLMMASYYGSSDAARWLLNEGADPTLRNDQGMTAADFARKGQREDLAKDIDAKTARGPASSGKW